MLKNTETQAFSRRLNQAISNHVLAPKGHGALTWLRNRLADAGTDLSINTVHKWSTAQARPRHDKMKTLAAVLGCDEVWLALGRSPAATPKDRAADARRADGAALVLAGLVRLSGGSVAYPRSDDDLAIENNIHMYAIIHAQQIRITTVVSVVDGDNVVFRVPRPTTGNRVIGLHRRSESPMGEVAIFDLTGAADSAREIRDGWEAISVDVNALTKPGSTKGIRRVQVFDDLAGPGNH